MDYFTGTFRLIEVPTINPLFGRETLYQLPIRNSLSTFSPRRRVTTLGACSSGSVRTVSLSVITYHVPRSENSSLVWVSRGFFPLVIGGVGGGTRGLELGMLGEREAEGDGDGLRS